MTEFASDITDFYPVIDCHYDRILKFFTSFSNPKNSKKSAVTLPTLRMGHVKAGLFAIPGMKPFLIKLFLGRWFRLVNNKKNQLAQIKNYEDILKISNEGKIGAILSCEGSGGFPADFKLFEKVVNKGLRVLSLCWKWPNIYASSSATKKTEDHPHLGITEKGFQLIQKSQSSGITLDVSHLSDEGFWDLMEITKKPIIATHSNSRTISNHPRNLTDDQIKAISKTGGLLGINFWPNILDPVRSNKNPNLEFVDIKRHIDHIVKIGGIECVAFGSDFDGTFTPNCVPDCSCYPSFLNYLSKNGYSKSDLSAIASENALRVFKDTWN